MVKYLIESRLKGFLVNQLESTHLCWACILHTNSGRMPVKTVCHQEIMMLVNYLCPVLCASITCCDSGFVHIWKHLKRSCLVLPGAVRHLNVWHKYVHIHVWMFAALWAAEWPQTDWCMWTFHLILTQLHILKQLWPHRGRHLDDLTHYTAANYWNPSMQLCCMKTSSICWEQREVYSWSTFVFLFIVFVVFFLSSPPCSRLGRPCWWTAAVSDVHPADMK